MNTYKNRIINPNATYPESIKKNGIPKRKIVTKIPAVIKNAFPIFLRNSIIIKILSSYIHYTKTVPNFTNLVKKG